MHVIEQWLGLRHAKFTPTLSWLAANLGIDRVQRTYASDRFAGNRRWMRLADVVKFPAHMGPAGCFDACVVLEPVVAGKSVGMDDACEVLQMRLGMLALLAVR